uniref:Uncharacterized protein n=1 Tax=Physcomitrium patens TaxID=3218 RepID=A0A7I4A521_PHYPA
MYSDVVIEDKFFTMQRIDVLLRRSIFFIGSIQFSPHHRIFSVQRLLPSGQLSVGNPSFDPLIKDIQDILCTVYELSSILNASNGQERDKDLQEAWQLTVIHPPFLIPLSTSRLEV